MVLQGPNERNFHIFYQLCSGATQEQREQLGISEPSYYSYLNSVGDWAETDEGVRLCEDWVETDAGTRRD